MEKFAKLGLSQGMLEVISELQFEKPSEIQEKAIPLAMAGKDIIGGSATGSGKTLAFATPIIEKLQPNKTVQALILTPTRELAEQVANSVRNFSKNKKLKTLAVYGGVNIQEQIRKIRNTDIIVGTPGRIIDHLARNTLNLNNVKFLVLDEVDRMFDMGFHQDVEKIIYKCPEDRQTMLFSATISSSIDYLAKKHTRNPEEVSVESYVEHSKLKQIYYDVENNMKFSLLVHLLNNEKAELAMVFCSTRRNVDFIESNLKKNNIEAVAIHGGLTQNKRSKIMREFKGKGETFVLVCTDIAARGLDIPKVSHIYNYDFPQTSNDYIHRIGRTARAGKQGIAISLLSSRDYENFSNVLKDESLKIERKELPEFKRIFIKINNNKSRFQNKRQGRFSRGNRKWSNQRKDGFRGSRGGRKSSHTNSKHLSKGRSYNRNRN